MPDTLTTEPTDELFGNLKDASLFEGLVEELDDEPTDALEETASPEPTAEPATEAATEATTTEPAKATEPDASAPTDETEADPLANATPLTYTVDGQAKTFEGAYVVPDLGAVIPTDKLTQLQDRLQQADRLRGVNQQLYDQVQTFERLGGVKAYEELKLQTAQQDAAGRIFLNALVNPENDTALTDLLARLALAETPQERQQLIQRSLLRDAQLAVREAALNARDTLTAQMTERESAAQQTAEAQTALTNAVTTLAQRHPSLTPEDVQAITRQAHRFASALIRPATPEEAPTIGVKPGERVLDLAALNDLLSERAQERAMLAKRADAAEAAGRENAKRLAAATTAGKASVTRTAPATPNANGRPGAGLPTPKPKGVEEMSYTEMKRRMLTGRFLSDTADDDAA
jgi:hypothetical protein